MAQRVVLMGIPIDNLSMEETLDRIDACIRTGRAAGKSFQAATVNVDFIVKALRDPELLAILKSVDLATADGMPLVWTSRFLGTALKARVTGADMVPALAALAAKKGYSIYFYGAGPGIAARAAVVLQSRFPGLTVAGVQSPPYSDQVVLDPAAIRDIRRANPDILLVGLGNPKQEKWISLYKSHLKVPFLMGVGGSLDFTAGCIRRAPVWMQRLCLEWFFRICQEPRRLWRRYLVDMVIFAGLFLKQWYAFQRVGYKKGRTTSFTG